eukprot:SAG31_NODE_9220_length_1314_cov_1.665021_2_plen_46_part_00
MVATSYAPEASMVAFARRPGVTDEAKRLNIKGQESGTSSQSQEHP